MASSSLLSRTTRYALVAGTIIAAAVAITTINVQRRRRRQRGAAAQPTTATSLSSSTTISTAKNTATAAAPRVQYTLHLLSTVQHLLPQIADMSYAEWPIAWQLFEVNSARDAEQWLRDTMCNDSRIPTMVVAVNKADGKAIGTAGLDVHDINVGPYKEIGPWMVSVQVLPEYRGQGVAAALVREIMLTGKRFGLSTTYLWTDAASGLYDKFGWKKVDRIHYAHEDVDIMQVDLSKYN